jgi:hypothetical protein
MHVRIPSAKNRWPQIIFSHAQKPVCDRSVKRGSRLMLHAEMLFFSNYHDLCVVLRATAGRKQVFWTQYAFGLV